MRASRSAGLVVVSIFTCWAFAGGAGTMTTASRAARSTITIGIYPSYTKVLPLASSRQPHEFSDRLQAVELQHRLLERRHAGGRQRAPRIVAELLDQRLGRQWPLRAAAAVRHTCFELTPVLETHAHPTGKAPRKLRVGIDHVAHPIRQRENARILEPRRLIGVETYGAVDERRGHRERQAELRVV